MTKRGRGRRVPRRRWAAAIAAMSVLAGCGSGDDSSSSTSDEAEAEIRLIGSGARWVGTSPLADGTALDTFDLTLLRTDPTVVGVEVFWEYAIITGERSQRSVPGNLLSLDFAVAQSLDDQPLLAGLYTPQVRGPAGRILESDDLRVSPTKGGFVVEYRFSPRSASDLVDADGNPIAIQSLEIVADFEAGTAGIGDVDYFEDRGSDGILTYDITLAGTADSALVSDTVTFTAEESDPDADRVENDPAAVAEAQRLRDEGAAELAGCEADVYQVDGSKFSFSSADGSTSVVVDLPPDWTVELKTFSDPCIPPSVNVDSPPAESYYDELGLSLYFSRPIESTLVAEAERLMEYANHSYSNEGELVSLQPGDDFYVAFDPLEELTEWDSPAVLMRSREEGDVDSAHEELLVWLDDYTIGVSWYRHSDSTFDDQLEIFWDAVTIA